MHRVEIERFFHFGIRRKKDMGEDDGEDGDVGKGVDEFTADLLGSESFGHGVGEQSITHRVDLAASRPVEMSSRDK